MLFLLKCNKETNIPENLLKNDTTEIRNIVSSLFDLISNFVDFVYSDHSHVVTMPENPTNETICTTSLRM